MVCMLVECVDVRLTKGESSLKAIAKIKIVDWGLIISEVKMFQKDGRYWCTLPDKDYMKDGKKCYYKFLTFEDKEQGQKIMDMALQCIRQRLTDGREFQKVVTNGGQWKAPRDSDLEEPNF